MNVKEFNSQFGNHKVYSFINCWIIYFLVDDSNEIVYVGKTSASGLGKRLLSHQRKGKQFSGYFAVDGPNTERDAYRLEGAFISFLKPKYNKSNLIVKPHEINYLAKWMNGLQDAAPIKVKAKRRNLTYDQAVSISLFWMVVFLVCMAPFLIGVDWFKGLSKFVQGLYFFFGLFALYAVSFSLKELSSLDKNMPIKAT